MRQMTVFLFCVAPIMAAALPAQGSGPAKASARTPSVREEGLRQELLQRMKRDQEFRASLLELMRARIPADSNKFKEVAKRGTEIDRQNTQRMKEIVKRYGWPGKSLVGTDGALAAWLLVQHADHDRSFQELCLGLLAQAFKQGEVPGEQVAYLTDRVRVGDCQKQIYGTQLRELNGRLDPREIEDRANVDERRKEMGLAPLADYLRMAEKTYLPAGHAK
jgi:hypothetical protein